MFNLNETHKMEKKKLKPNLHKSLSTAHICVCIIVHNVVHNTARSSSDYLTS